MFAILFSLIIPFKRYFSRGNRFFLSKFLMIKIYSNECQVIAYSVTKFETVILASFLFISHIL